VSIPILQGDSGSILIGAGTPDTEHNKQDFSTYGERVNVQSWGREVMTAGPCTPACHGPQLQYKR
jgi:hypothetical protein